jgi:hypothetical protein
MSADVFGVKTCSLTMKRTMSRGTRNPVYLNEIAWGRKVPVNVIGFELLTVETY